MAEDQSLATAKMASAIGRATVDEIARRDINEIRQLKLLVEMALDQRIDARIEQWVNDWVVNKLNRQLEEILVKVSSIHKEYIDKRCQAISEQLKIIGHPVGQWKPGQLYHRYQVVTHDGSQYFCQAESTWATPAEGQIEWQLRARGVPDASDEIPHTGIGNGNGLAHDDCR